MSNEAQMTNSVQAIHISCDATTREGEWMCTFKDERTVQVCDVAIEKVRGTLDAAFGNDVSFTRVDGGGTLIKAAAPVDPEGFSRLAREAIASAEKEAEQASN